MKRGWIICILLLLLGVLGILVGRTHGPPDYGKPATAESINPLPTTEFSPTGKPNREEETIQRTGVITRSHGLKVHVVESEVGKTIENARVYLAQIGTRLQPGPRIPQGETTADGSLWIQGPVPSSHAILASCRGYADGMVVPPSGVGEVRVSLERLHECEVTLRSQGGDAVPDAWVHVSQSQLLRAPPTAYVQAGPGPNRRDAIFSARSDREGRATLRVPQGEYTLIVAHPRFAWIPGREWTQFQLPRVAGLELILAEPWGAVFSLKGIDVIAEEFYLGPCADRVEHAGYQVERVVGEMRRRFAPCTAGALFLPDSMYGDGSSMQEAQLRLLVRDRGWVTTRTALRPCSSIDVPAEVKFDQVSPVEWGDLEIAMDAVDCSFDVDKLTVKVRPYGESSGMWYVHTSFGQRLRLPKGTYAVSIVDRPVLSNLAAGVGVARIDPGKMCSWVLRPSRPLQECQLSAQAYDGRFLPVVSFRIRGLIDLTLNSFYEQAITVCLPRATFEVACVSPGLASRSEVLTVDAHMKSETVLILREQ